ncbi:MAG: SGNH/GDSL hydrolase family protein [Ruminococcaceae bacterium]|nr:SGNH/GDSL hydrolase family protein [Oscillospiraceae bacterium]
MKTYFIGCTSVLEEDGFLVPSRLTEAQMKAVSRREAYLKCAGCTAGTGIGAVTAATQVSFSYSITNRVRPNAYVDILIDGVLQAAENLTEDSGVATLLLPGTGERTVQLMFPHLARLRVKDVQWNAPVRPIPKKEQFWLFFGDSITQGMHSAHPAITYPRLAATYAGCDYINMGICGGKFSAEDIDRVDREPDIITVAFGTNDWRQAEDKESFRQSVEAYLVRLTEVFSCRHIFGILPTWRNDADAVYGGMTFTEMREIIRKEYEKYSFIRVLDGMRLVPPLEDFYGDHQPAVHLNESGFLHFAAALVREKEIQNVLNI